MNALVVIALLGASTLAAILYAVYTWRASCGAERDVLRHRLDSSLSGRPPEPATTGDIFRKESLSAIPRLNRLLRWLSPARHLDRLLRQAGLGLSVANTLYVMGFLNLGTALLLQLALGWPRPVAIVTGLIVGGPGVFAYIRWRRNKRLQAFAAQLPSALDMIRSSVRAGHTLNYALEIAVDELKEPIVSEFRTVLAEMRLGLSLKGAFEHLYLRVPLQELRMFILAVVLSREVGGNLSEVLGTLATTLRDRMKLRQQIRALSAQGRASSALLFLLPPGVAFGANLMRPGFIDPLFHHPTGRLLLIAALGFQTAGFLLARRVVNPKEVRFV